MLPSSISFELFQIRDGSRIRTVSPVMGKKMRMVILKIYYMDNLSGVWKHVSRGK